MRARVVVRGDLALGGHEGLSIMAVLQRMQISVGNGLQDLGRNSNKGTNLIGWVKGNSRGGCEDTEMMQIGEKKNINDTVSTGARLPRPGSVRHGMEGVSIETVGGPSLLVREGRSSHHCRRE